MTWHTSDKNLGNRPPGAILVMIKLFCLPIGGVDTYSELCCFQGGNDLWKTCSTKYYGQESQETQGAFRVSIEKDCFSLWRELCIRSRWYNDSQNQEYGNDKT